MVKLYFVVKWHFVVRLSIKIIMFSGKPAGWLKKGATGDFFFPFCNFFFSKNGQYFATKKKVKKNAVARLALILATCWTGNKLFFMDSLRPYLW